MRQSAYRDRGVDAHRQPAPRPRPAGVHTPSRCALRSVNNSVQLLQASTRAPIYASRHGTVCAGDSMPFVTTAARSVDARFRHRPAHDQNSEPGSPTFPRTADRSLISSEARCCSSRASSALSNPDAICRTRRSRGQSSSCAMQADPTVITVFEGTVRATNDQGMLLVGAGQQGVAIQGQAPQLQVIVRPQDAVQWALVLRADLRRIPSRSSPRSRTRLETHIYVRRASLLLSAGQLTRRALILTRRRISIRPTETVCAAQHRFRGSERQGGSPR